MFEYILNKQAYVLRQRLTKVNKFWSSERIGARAKSILWQ
jgi:hypothetical protein